MAYAASNNGQEFRVVATVANDLPENTKQAICRQFKVEGLDLDARCVRVRAKNVKQWLFVDEIMVNPLANSN